MKFQLVGVSPADVTVQSGWNPNQGKDLPPPSSSCSEGNADLPRQLILLVEDSTSDLLLLRMAIQSAGVKANLHVVSDGEMAINFIDQADADDQNPFPSLVILDLNLPKRTGSEVLEHLGRARKFGDTRVLIVTSSNSDQDRARTAMLGADRYFRKPSVYQEFLKVGEIVKEMLESNPLEGKTPSN